MSATFEWLINLGYSSCLPSSLPWPISLGGGEKGGRNEGGGGGRKEVGEDLNLGITVGKYFQAQFLVYSP